MPDFSGREVNDIVPILATGRRATNQYFQTVTLGLTAIISGGKTKERVAPTAAGGAAHGVSPHGRFRLFLEACCIPLRVGTFSDPVASAVLDALQKSLLGTRHTPTAQYMPEYDA